MLTPSMESASSLLLAPATSAPLPGGHTGLRDRLTSSSTLLLDVVPFEAALQRLLHEKVASDEQLSSYSVQQAYRGLLYAARAATLTLRGVHQPLGGEGDVTEAARERDASSGEACVVRGWQAVLYRMALAAVRSAAALTCVVFLSTRLLCDPASAYGEGNERPCCTREWTEALLRGLPLGQETWSGGELQHTSSGVRGPTAAATQELDRRFGRLVQTNRRYQLGFVLLLANTLRAVGTGCVEGQRLCTEHASLFAGVATHVLPCVAHHVEESMRADTVLSSAYGRDGSGAPPRRPTRLTVELNHLIVHGAYWLTMDVIAAHVDAEADAALGEDGAAQQRKPKRKRPLVVDRDQPVCLWKCVTLVRNALRRSLRWLAEEFTLGGTRSDEDRNGSSNSGRGATALLEATSLRLERVVTDLLKHQERLELALLNATREFGGAVSDSVRRLTEAKWAHTLQMGFVVRNLTGMWVAVHGGLGLSILAQDAVLPTNKDVLMLVASTLLRVPDLEGGKESEQSVLMATDAMLCAALVLVAAAPTADLQAELWMADSAVTQQIHSLLVRRGLHYRNERVLELASLLSRAVLDAAVQDGALAGFAASSSDQLLTLLEGDDDAASKCAGELLCVAVLEHPYRLIPSLFRLLQHGSASTRRHVLEVLCSLPDLASPQAHSDTDAETAPLMRADDSPVASRSHPLAERQRNMLRLLAENLLLQLQDEELCVRLLSSSLFAKVHPEDVLLPLLNIYVQRDPTGRRQSAAQAALTAVLTAHTANAVTYLRLLEYGYQCHCAAAGKDRGAGSTGDSGSACAPAAPHRPTPQTPGDVLSHALLYSVADESAAAAPCGAALGGTDTKAPPGLLVGRPAGGASAGGGGASSGVAGSGRRAEAQLQSVLLTLTDRWVQAAGGAAPLHWTSAQHSLPILRCLASPASRADADEAATSGTGEGERVQWTMKYVLRLTAVLTGQPADEEALPAATLAQRRTAHLTAIWDVFFAAAPSPPCSPAGAASLDVWTSLVCTAPDTGSAASRLHAVLMPLLCLRSCGPGTLAASAPPMSADSERSTDSAKVSATAAAPVAGSDPAPVVGRLWDALWGSTAASQTPAAAAFFAAYPDIQRVLLEVLCRFPATHFFGAWVTWLAAVDAKAAPTASSSSAHLSALASARLYPYRVYLFGVSSYLAAGAAQSAARGHDRSEPLGEVDVVLQHSDVLERLLLEEVPQWLMEESVPQPAAGAAVPADVAKAEALRQRLCTAAVDAAAVLTVVALTRRDGATPAACSGASPVTGYGGGGAGALEALCGRFVEAPLTNLCAAYRRADAAPESAGTPAAAAGWPGLLTRFQLCLRVHQSLFRAIAMQPRSASNPAAVLLAWFMRFLRPLVELSNASCRSDVGRGPHGCRAATDACGLVFQAVLLARKLDDSVTAPAPTRGDAGKHGSSTDTAASLLTRLPWEEKAALVSFSVGCVRFAASAAVQATGVRLLSAVLVAAPELFLELEAAQASAPSSSSSPVPSAVRVSGSGGGYGGGIAPFSDAQRPLSTAASALQSIALMHADRPTRQLADEVLRMLEKAATASTA